MGLLVGYVFYRRRHGLPLNPFPAKTPPTINSYASYNSPQPANDKVVTPSGINSNVSYAAPTELTNVPVKPPMPIAPVVLFNTPPAQQVVPPSMPVMLPPLPAIQPKPLIVETKIVIPTPVPTSVPAISNYLYQLPPGPADYTQGSDKNLRIPPVLQLNPVHTHEIALSDLDGIIMTMSANSDFAFSEEFECLESGDEFSREAAICFENKLKNRFANILAYDYSRVRLSLQGNDMFSDYINANFINGYKKPKAYIAAQGPTMGSVNDFWRLIWEAETTILIMLTNLEEKFKIKCHRYWPQDVTCSLDFYDITVTLINEELFPDFVIRSLEVSKPGHKTRLVRQFHYVSWPDHGVPESTAGTLSLIQKVKAVRVESNAPILVHCSAGVGRTGTLIAIDFNLERAKAENVVDVFGHINFMRRQRSTMVQTEDQYAFIYRTLADGCIKTKTELASGEIRAHLASLRKNQPNGVTVLEQEFKLLQEHSQLPNVLRTDTAQLPINKPKNRFFPSVLPYETTRVKLASQPGVAGSDYINASWIDGYNQRGALIATQGPLENTVQDFWRMVWERESNVIVMLTQTFEADRPKSEQYWPLVTGETLTTGDYRICLRSEVNRGFCVEHTLDVTDVVSETVREVMHYQSFEWPAAGVPPSGAATINLIRALQKYQMSKVTLPEEDDIYGNSTSITEQATIRQLKPIVVHCSAGVGRTGVFCALIVLLKRLMIDDKIDVLGTVKHLRTQRMSLVQTMDQYEFIYRCVVDWMDRFVNRTDSLKVSRNDASAQPVYGNVERPASYVISVRSSVIEHQEGGDDDGGFSA